MLLYIVLILLLYYTHNFTLFYIIMLFILLHYINTVTNLDFSENRATDNCFT